MKKEKGMGVSSLGNNGLEKSNQRYKPRKYRLSPVGLRFATTLIFTTLLLFYTAVCSALPSLKTSNNNRFMIQGSGSPFFWLADDGWGLHNRLTLSAASNYLNIRKAQGFTVIHTWLTLVWMQQNLNGDQPSDLAINTETIMFGNFMIRPNSRHAQMLMPTGKQP
ncbi:MAG: DUF4038 domain-containing protein [Gammaproteobacteria bacterium]|nr:DUF4038 domain-containing protein [Gammaproteobacteria bacterium]